MPAGQRDQSAAALPIWGGRPLSPRLRRPGETATARLTLCVVLVTPFVVRVIRRLPDVSSIENG